jgi:hypothetical protein
MFCIEVVLFYNDGGLRAAARTWGSFGVDNPIWALELTAACSPTLEEACKFLLLKLGDGFRVYLFDVLTERIPINRAKQFAFHAKIS